MAVTNHAPEPVHFQIAPDTTRAVGAVGFILVALIVGLVIIAVVAGIDIPAMEDFTTVPTPLSSGLPGS